MTQSACEQPYIWRISTHWIQRAKTLSLIPLPPRLMENVVRVPAGLEEGCMKRGRKVAHWRGVSLESTGTAVFLP